MANPDNVTVRDLLIRRETDNAVGIVPDSDPSTEIIWIPLSQVASLHRSGNHVDICMTRWIAEKKGLI